MALAACARRCTPRPAYRMVGAGQTAPARIPALLCVAAFLPLAGCDPVFDLEGAFFPSWMLCLLGGIVVAAALRPLFARVGIEPHLGPLALVYSCLALAVSFAAWLMLFHT